MSTDGNRGSAMPSNTHAVTRTRPSASEDVIRRLRDRFAAEQELRRGICLLNAAKYDEAALAFSRAAVHGCDRSSLASYIAACHAGKGEWDAAADRLTGAVETGQSDVACCVRQALALWSAGHRDQAVARLRDAIRHHAESAELHFQLGTLLADAEAYEEAELRFVQAINLDRTHAEAMVSLAMIHGLKQMPDEALKQLQRAQQIKPYDPRIALLLAHAAAAVRQAGRAPRLQPVMPEAVADDDPSGLVELAGIIESDPDFIDALLAVPGGQLDDRVFVVMLTAIETMLERRPDSAALHFRAAQLLERLGRETDAIDAHERAVGLDPKFGKALLALARLYQKTDRTAEATRRLEQAVAAGAQYADAFYLLGNLYRQRGLVTKARSAYRRALHINSGYVQAREALETLAPAES